MNEEPILNLNKDEKPHSKNKTVGRISRLFQKKPKKKSSSLAPSISSISLSEQQQQQQHGLSKQSTYQSSSSIASSQISAQQQQQYLEASDRNSYMDTRSIQMNNDAGKILERLISVVDCIREGWEVVEGRRDIREELPPR